MVVLECVVNLFEDYGEEKQLQLVQLFDEVDKECKSKSLAKIDIKHILNSIDELEFYNLIDLNKSKKEIKNSKFSLKVDLQELQKDLITLSTVGPSKAPQEPQQIPKKTSQ